MLCRANIPLAQVEVRFQDLSVDADIAVGSSGLPSVYNTYKNTLLVRCLAMHVCACSSVPAPGDPHHLHRFLRCNLHLETAAVASTKLCLAMISMGCEAGIPP